MLRGTRKKWSNIITDWCPREGRRNRGRQSKRVKLEHLHMVSLSDCWIVTIVLIITGQTGGSTIGGVRYDDYHLYALGRSKRK
ncbi:hypothetical protein EVAR_94861_1 [Eumeta japonica]|uniref:Uncharacterized protein n=1 Tax=Eumeta variegata TaxID=151549 RepID=A0A4C1VA10_EUMVA|nr:hypothetical protein EVAR_94861_1 [Eumeta japonica]